MAINVNTQAHIDDATKRNIVICATLLDTVVATGRNGAPAGVMYAALCSVLSLDRFMALMGILVKAGKVRYSGHVYYDASLPQR